MSHATTSDNEAGPNQEHLQQQYARNEQARREQPEASMAGPGYPWSEPQRSSGGCAYPENVGRNERLVSLGAGAALVAIGLARGKLSGLMLGALGGSLIYRGFSGHCHAYQALGIDTAKHNSATTVPAGRGYKVEKAIAVHRSPKELYSFWRDFSNLPQVMKHLKRVDVADRQRSHWVAKGMLGYDVEWDAEIYNEREDEMIAWRSLPGGDIDTAGSVHFKTLEHDRGTEVRVSLKFNPPGGKVGASLASLLGSDLKTRIGEDLRNFKRLMESGEIPTKGDEIAIRGE